MYKHRKTAALAQYEQRANATVTNQHGALIFVNLNLYNDSFWQGNNFSAKVG
jgi:hypothetical protein